MTTTIKISDLNTIEATLGYLANAIPTVVCRDGRQYPFIGEKGVRKAIEDNADLKVANAVLMFWLQTDVEQAKRETTDKNKRGLMSSHAATATKVITALLAGQELDESLEYKCDGFKFTGHEAYLTHVGSRYAKQLSVALRAFAMQQEPELAVTAGMFSVR